MCRIYKSIEKEDEWLPRAGERDGEKMPTSTEFTFWVDKNVLELDHSEGFITL